MNWRTFTEWGWSIKFMLSNPKFDLNWLYQLQTWHVQLLFQPSSCTCGVWEWQKWCWTCAPDLSPLPTYQILVLFIMNKFSLFFFNSHSNCDLIALCVNDNISIPLLLTVHFMSHYAKEVTFNASLCPTFCWKHLHDIASNLLAPKELL